MSITLSFDIGHASIGWAVISAPKALPSEPEILGTGVVIFPSDDCLASKRRDLRRTRRHIRSTRQRIERLKKWLESRGVLKRQDLDEPGHPAPFLLAAAALRGHVQLTAQELWHVLRWYAHNRGYDGNSRWAKADAAGSADPDNAEAEDDTEKQKNAFELMRKYRTSTMAETVCACLGLDPANSAERISSFLPYKTLNAAFPRPIVEKEVSDLLNLHMGVIPGLDAVTVCMILTTSELLDNKRRTLAGAGIKLPLRYQGGLLFGQLVPRFDNRIISRCPLTWAAIYDREIEAGKQADEARKTADRDSKVPTVRAKEFLEYRFARLLANIRFDGAPLPAVVRRQLFQKAEIEGRYTLRTLKAEITALMGQGKSNLDDFFKTHPDSEKSLVLDHALAYAGSNQLVAQIWQLVPPSVQSKVLELWRRNKPVPLGQILEWTKSISQADADEMLRRIEGKAAGLKKTRKNQSPSLADTLMRPLCPPDLSGRAPYARPILAKVVEEVLSGYDPNKPAKSPDHPEGEEKPTDGVLYPLLDPGSRVRQLQNERPLDQLTNNHLVRHRLLILERLLDAITEDFCGGDPRKVSRCVVEVGRELKEFSGKTAKEIASELNNKLKDFKAAVNYLQEHVPDLKVSGSLIRKCRIAMDLNWTCPFTGDVYDAAALPKMEWEHIVPYSARATNAMHALVLTWPEINRMKGKRTAYQFILDDQTKPVPNRTNLTIQTIQQYEKFVAGLDEKGHSDDKRRKASRKALLLTKDMDDKELGFTPGQMTQSSQLMKLAMRGIVKRYPDAKTDAIPGVVNAEIRRAWNLTGTLSRACPEVIDPETGKIRPKDEIRGLTHLHHALDAAILGLTAHYFPLQFRGQDIKGKLWEAVLRRQKTDDDWALLRALKIGKRDQEGRMVLEEPTPAVKNQLALRLAECRVMQHVPADRS